jgi:tetratricopeptide (TPR) repeat protein
MARIYDLTDEDTIEGTILTATSGGLLGSQYLADGPPASHLDEHEQPQYIVRNKEGGVTITRESTVETIAPGDEYQALAIVTDVRVVFVIGADGGDQVRSVQFADVAEARVGSSGLLTSNLRVVTTDGEVWTFPVRGDPSGVAAYVDNAAQTWANASRLVDEAEERIDRSREHFEADRLDRARNVLAEVPGRLDLGEERIAAVGEGARESMIQRTRPLRDRIGQLRREIAAMKGGQHHANAHTAWKQDHDFEAAARQYDMAVAEYERALEAGGQTPTADQLASRLEGARKEREILRIAPMADAKAAWELATEADDPETAAEEWEAALACYREAVTLDWGTGEWGFEVQRDLAQERAIEATDESIDAHVEAGQEWLIAADRIAASGRRTEARQAYERARDHFSNAHDIATELRPDRVEGLADSLETVDDRLSGKVVPGTVPQKETLSVEAVADLLGEIPDRRRTRHRDSVEHANRGASDASTSESSAEQTAKSVDSTDSSDPTPAIRPVDSETTRSTPAMDAPTPTASESSETSDTDSESGPTPAIHRVDEQSESPAGTTSTENSQSTAETGHPGESDASDAAEGAPETGDAAAQEDKSDPLSSLRAMDESAFTDLVADVLAVDGWSTTVFSSTASTVYDIVAIRGDERQLVWTIHRPDGGALGATIVRRCATSRDRSERTDKATIVTTGTLSNAASRRAGELDVTVIDSEELVERATEADLLD